jgi:hypothetical protein
LTQAKIIRFDPAVSSQEELQNITYKLSSGVLALPFEISIGFDIRFACDAYVVVVNKDQLDPEFVKQCIGRGSRSYGPQEGRVFFVGDQHLESAYLDRLFTNRGEDFKHGARNLQILKKFAEDKNNKRYFDEFIKQREGKWKMSTNEFITTTIPDLAAILKATDNNL